MLAGCNPSAEKAGTGKTAASAATPSSKTLAASVDAGLGRVISNAGLTTALEGVGPYTLFAPPDATLKSGVDFTDPAVKAEGAALLRAHIVPGTLTRADLKAAIDRSGGKGAQMRTMAGGLLTFTRDGEKIVATGPDGASAHLTGKEDLVSNGALQPTDGLLVKPAATAG